MKGIFIVVLIVISLVFLNKFFCFFFKFFDVLSEIANKFSSYLVRKMIHDSYEIFTSITENYL